MSKYFSLFVAGAMACASFAALAQPEPEPHPGFSDGPSIVHLNTDRMMTIVLVDGAAMVEASDCTTPKSCVIYDVAPGMHELDIRSGLTGKKTLYAGRTHIPGGAEVWAKVRGGTIEIYNVQPRTDVASTTTVVTGPAGATTQHTTTTTTTTVEGVPGISVGIHVGETGMGDIGIGAGVTVTESTTTVHETSSQVEPEPVVVSGRGVLELTSTDGESFTVFIDGKERGTCNCMDGQSIKVRGVEAGEHVLVIKDFMGEETITRGRVWVDPGFTLKLGVGDGIVEAYNRPDFWLPNH